MCLGSHRRQSCGDVAKFDAERGGGWNHLEERARQFVEIGVVGDDIVSDEVMKVRNRQVIDVILVTRVYCDDGVILDDAPHRTLLVR